MKNTVETLLLLMKQAIKKDHALLVSGFGKFEAYSKQARKGATPDGRIHHPASAKGCGFSSFPQVPGGTQRRGRSGGIDMTPVYFVIPETQRKKWPAQLHEAALGQYSVDEIAAFFTAGVDVHILQTWLLLKEREREFSFHLVSHAVKDEICVFHYDNAKPRHGLLDCFSIVVRADRPPVPYADIVLEQNPLASGAAWHMPHWVQPGLIPRMKAGQIVLNG